MRAVLGRAEDFRGTIVRFRGKLSHQIGFCSTDTAPLPYAFYLFASESRDAEPTAMAELFFYDQAFDSYSTCSFAEAFDLERLVPLNRVIHLRSLVASDAASRVALLRCLGRVVAQIATRLGARYLTADPLLLEPDFLVACAALGSPRIGRYSEQAGELALALVSLRPIAADEGLDDAHAIDPLLLQTIRLRGHCALKAHARTDMRLDTLLPAHWVGVWQRQLRAFAM